MPRFGIFLAGCVMLLVRPAAGQYLAWGASAGAYLCGTADPRPMNHDVIALLVDAGFDGRADYPFPDPPYVTGDDISLQQTTLYATNPPGTPWADLGEQVYVNTGGTVSLTVFARWIMPGTFNYADGPVTNITLAHGSAFPPQLQCYEFNSNLVLGARLRSVAIIDFAAPCADPILDVQPGPTGTVLTLATASGDGNTYQVQRAPMLSGAWTNVGPLFTGVDGLITNWVDPDGAGDRFFYRMRVQDTNYELESGP